MKLEQIAQQIYEKKISFRMGKILSNYWGYTKYDLRKAGINEKNNNIIVDHIHFDNKSV